MNSEARANIRKFIFTTLQKEMDRCINGMKEDKTDYNLEAASLQLLHTAKASGVDVDGTSKAKDKADAKDEDKAAPEAEEGEGESEEAEGETPDAEGADAGEADADAGDAEKPAESGEGA
jgi:hypothetical protein